MSTTKTQVKVACLACRSSKTRCNGQHPCATCIANERECRYRPSKRGGARRGERYQNAKQRTPAVSSQTPEFSYGSTHDNNSLGDNIVDLIYPLHEIRNVDNFVDTGIPSDMNLNADQRISSGTPGLLMLRAYRSDADLINAYYIFIHPYLPLLPPPDELPTTDCPCSVPVTEIEPHHSCLPFRPKSPLGLALMAILALIPLSDELDPIREPAITLRKSYSKMYVQATLESIESSTSYDDAGPAGSFSTSLPPVLDGILALLLLAVYEFSQNSNRKRMRSHAHHALTLAMDLSLHTSGSDFDPEVKQRVWWMTMFLVYQSAILNHSSPIVLMNDQRITTPFPVFAGCREVIPALMKAQDVLLKTTDIHKTLKKGNITGSHESIRQHITELNSYILTVAAELSCFQTVKTTGGVDASAAHNLFLTGRFLIHTARIKLHRFRAFGDYPVFLDKFCDLNSLNSTIDSAQLSEFPSGFSPAHLEDIDSIFPFTEQESTNICLKSALVLSRVLRNLEWPNPSCSEMKPSEVTVGCSMPTLRHQYPRSLPYMACCGMQSCYVLIMLLQKVRASLDAGNFASYYHLPDQEPGSEMEDAERLIEELRHGVKSVCEFMSSNAIFEGFRDMAREVESIYEVSFHS
ncbi:hypothetical protein PENPOL_c004G01318 [Penicillium polonicum]|uniref:Zn(2)-C6 fungal-type domain-containing protein n=1 Tax=Penicillium polonicum TaxID=60169 RepID=A0A1V6NQF5_PENPO|nr:hypothetical protein PENPOL_c004G01318 [Penicillium polonicum]